MRRLRMLVVAVLVALVAAACGGDVVEELPFATGSPVPASAPPTPQDGATTGDAAGGEEGAAGEGAQPQDQGAAGDDSQDAGDAAGAEDAGGQQPALAPVTDGGPVGANAAAYLRGDRPRVVLEIDVQDGARLPDSVIAHVREVLDRESGGTVEVQTGPATTTRRDAWTADQLRAAAADTRSVAHADDTAVLHLLVLRDGYEDEGVLGLAVGSSSAVVFPDQWSDLTTALLSGDRIARAVTTHEVGHLLGLVGLYEQPTSDHEDPDHPGHTTDRDDVMYYAVERDVISQLDGIPTDFGERTRADLAAIREG